MRVSSIFRIVGAQTEQNKGDCQATDDVPVIASGELRREHRPNTARSAVIARGDLRAHTCGTRSPVDVHPAYSNTEMHRQG